MTQSGPTLEELLRSADTLIREARRKRKEADRLLRETEEASAPGRGQDPNRTAALQQALADAKADLSAAVDLLEPELRRRESGLTTTLRSMGALEDRKDLAVRLADCYGSLGGIARRASDHGLALELYRKGRDLEMNSAYGIKSTYNRVQWIVMQVLVDPSSVSSDSELAGHTRGLLELLSGGTVQDAWTSADILLLAAISDDRRRLRRAWDALVASHPAADVYKSGLLVLQDLAVKVPGNALLLYAIDLYRSQLTELTSASSPQSA